MTDAFAAPAHQIGPDFEAFFRSASTPYMILDRELRFVDANDAYCAVTERTREELIGRNVFEMFPNPGEPGRRVRESFEHVLATGQAHSMPLIEYPIQLPLSRGGGFELRYWSAVHTPLPGPDGTTAYVVQNTVDVTDLQRLKAMAYGPADAAGEHAPAEATLLQRTQEVEAANRLLEAETRSLRDLFLQAPGFMAVLAGADLIFTLANETYQQLIGHRPVIGRPLLHALPEIADQGFADLLYGVMRTGEPFLGEALSVMLQRTPGAPLEERFVDFIYQPMRAADGSIWGVFVQGSDVTGRVLAERQQKLLLDELNHRVKNTLATVQAIADQTLRSTADPAAFREAFDSRLMALSATHNLLTEGAWSGASLREVVQLEFTPYGPERYRLTGPDVALTPAQALALGLLFHELATNAAKHGALQSGQGCVRVTWDVRPRGDGRELAIEWAERDGPLVTPPTHRGFGSRLIERSLEGALGGRTTVEYAPHGLTCRITLPVETA